MTNKVYEIYKSEVEKIKLNSNTISIFLVGSSKNLDLNSNSKDVNDIDIFVFTNQVENQIREIKKIEGIEFDVNYFSKTWFENLIVNKEYFFLKEMKDAKIVFDRNNTANEIIQLCKMKYLQGPDNISDEEKYFIKSEIESSITRLENKAKFEKNEYEFLVNLYLKDLIVGYFTINNQWVPKDKKLFKELKIQEPHLYELVTTVNCDDKYEKLMKVHNYIFKNIITKNYIKITY